MSKILCWAAVGALLVGAAVQADQKKEGTNTSPPEAAAKAKASPAVAAVSQTALAQSLINYGRKNKAPEALITAARILAHNAGPELGQKPKSEADPKAPKAPDKGPKPAADNSPRALLEEAKKMSDNNPAVVALANAVELSRGAVGGPKQGYETVRAYSTDSYRISFRGGEVARVAISGDGDTRLDLYVYDENGNLVDSCVGPGDDCICSWVPRWTGPFTIRVVNRGGVYNRYFMVTN